MRKKKEMSLHDLAVRLCEGGIVDYGGFALKAKEVDMNETACNLCNMDCACNLSITDLCAECDAVTHTKHILMFANEQK